MKMSKVNKGNKNKKNNQSPDQEVNDMFGASKVNMFEVKEAIKITKTTNVLENDEPVGINPMAQEADDSDLESAFSDVDVNDIKLQPTKETDADVQAVNDIMTDDVQEDLEPDVYEQYIEEEEEKAPSPIEDISKNDFNGTDDIELTPKQAKTEPVILADDEEDGPVVINLSDYTDTDDEENEKESSYIRDLLSYLTSGQLMKSIKEKSKTAGVSPKKVAHTFFQKVLGVIRDVLGTAFVVIGETFKYVVDLLYAILASGGKILSKVAHRMLGVITLGYSFSNADS